MSDFASSLIFTIWVAGILRNSGICGLLTEHEVKMSGYWQSSFFACFIYGRTETESRSINSHKKNELGQSLVNKGFIIWFSRKFFSMDTAGSRPKRAR